MRIVLQRISHASVTVDDKVIGKSSKGLLLLVGVTHEDTEKTADWLCEKSLNLRIFDDENGKMNLSCLDISGDILAVSQFTLYGDTKRGRRPGYDKAATPEKAEHLFNYFVSKLKESGLNVETGAFGEHMKVSLLNDGPATFILER